MRACSPSMTPVGLLRQMDRVLGGLLSEPAGVTTGLGVPPINVREDDHAVIVEAELPGFTVEQVEVTWERQVLTVRGQRETEAGEPGVKVLHRERRSGEFARAIQIARDIDTAGVTAGMTDGVLTVRLPKAAKAQPRRIAVSATN